MELRHLRYFVCVADELHFGRAAALLGISQPPLSQQIRALEEELGVALFERTSRRVRLTEAGRLFLVEARRTLEQAAHAVEVARRTRKGEVGELSIGFIASVPFVPRVASALFRFRTAYPAVHLNLAEMPRDVQIPSLVERRLDIGFMRGDKPRGLPPELIADVFLEEEMIVGMHRDHPLAARKDALRVADLRDEPFVLYEHDFSSGFNDHLFALCRRAGFDPDVVQEASGIATLLGLVAAGFGLTVIGRSLSALHLDNVVYRVLADPDAISRLWIIHHRDPTATARSFTELVARKVD
jgi:DNA-binding transcriptional LysR family regulator